MESTPNVPGKTLRLRPLVIDDFDALVELQGSP